MPCIRNSAARCDCGCVVSIKVVDWCEDDQVVDFVGIKVYEVVEGERGDLLLDASTGDSGTLATDLPPGDYIVEATKTGYHGYNTIRALGCGVNLLKLTATGGFAISVSGCEAEFGGSVGTLDDARVVITGPRSYELITENGGVVWYPEVPGEYHFEITHPSGRFKPESADRTVVEACSPGSLSVILEPEDDYTCCYVDQCPPGEEDPPAPPIPRGKLVVTTSAGDTWEFVGCEDIYCSFTDEVQAGGPPKSVTLPGPGGGCTYSDFPDDLGTAVLPCKVRIVRSYVDYESGWAAQLAPPHDGVSWSYGLTRRDPMNFAGCRNQAGASNHWLSKKWYRTGDCPNPGVNGDWTWFVVGELVNCDPLTVTFTFENTSPESYAEEWTGGAEDGPAFFIPPPIRTITITEVV